MSVEIAALSNATASRLGSAELRFYVGFSCVIAAALLLGLRARCSSGCGCQTGRNRSVSEPVTVSSNFSRLVALEAVDEDDVGLERTAVAVVVARETALVHAVELRRAGAVGVPCRAAGQ